MNEFNVKNVSEFIDLKEAAAFLDCHPVTLTRKAQESKVPAYKRMNKWMFKKADLMALFKPNGAVVK